MHLTIAYSKTKKQNLVLINNATYQRETLSISERPIRQPLKLHLNDIIPNTEELKENIKREEEH